jgi:hypothetical protein
MSVEHLLSEEPVVYLVVWEDSASPDAGWHEKDVTVSPVLCRTVGYILDDEPNHVTIVQTTDESQNWSGAMAIPRSAIRAMQIWLPLEPYRYECGRPLPVEEDPS